SLKKRPFLGQLLLRQGVGLQGGHVFIQWNIPKDGHTEYPKQVNGTGCEQKVESVLNTAPIGQPGAQRQGNQASQETRKEPRVQNGLVDRLESGQVFPGREFPQSSCNRTGITVKQSGHQSGQQTGDSGY